MRIVFDGGCLRDGPPTGVARAFLDGLEAYAQAWPGELALLLPEGATAPAFAGVQIAGAPCSAWRRQLGLPRLLRELGAAVLHSPVAAVPLFAACPTIATVHDLPWLDPGSGERTSLRRRAATRLALRAASAVLAPSRFTFAAARALVRPERLHLVPHGLPPLPPEPALPRDGPLLALGDDRPRKNRARVARAHRLAAERRPDLPPLRFVGPPHDYVDERTKLHLLRSCRAVVQASLFEGFGLPVLEALRAGAPLVCSDLPPFRELAGDDAVYVDPRDENSIAIGLLRALDPEFAAHAALAGPRRAAAFPIAATVQQWRTLHLELAR